MKKVKITSILIFSIMLLGACSSNAQNKNTEDNSELKPVEKVAKIKEQHKAKDSSLLENNAEFKKITSNFDNSGSVKIKEEKEYTPNHRDTSWGGIDLLIDKVEVVKTSDIYGYSGNKYTGFVALHYVITSTQKDAALYPSQGILQTNTGEQVDDFGYVTTGNLDGDIMKGSKKTGWCVYLLQRMKSVDEVSGTRIKFSANYETETYNEAAFHDYDIALKLK